MTLHLTVIPVRLHKPPHRPIFKQLTKATAYSVCLCTAENEIKAWRLHHVGILYNLTPNGVFYMQSNIFFLTD